MKPTNNPIKIGVIILSYNDLFYNAIGIAVGVIFYKFLMLIITNSSVFF